MPSGRTSAPIALTVYPGCGSPSSNVTPQNPASLQPSQPSSTSQQQGPVIGQSQTTRELRRTAEITTCFYCNRCVNSGCRSPNKNAFPPSHAPVSSDCVFGPGPAIQYLPLYYHFHGLRDDEFNYGRHLEKASCNLGGAKAPPEADPGLDYTPRIGVFYDSDTGDDQPPYEDLGGHEFVDHGLGYDDSTESEQDKDEHVNDENTDPLTKEWT